MKITVNYISNVFLAVILAVIPYTALIKLFIKNNDTPFLNVEMVLIIIEDLTKNPLGIYIKYYSIYFSCYRS